MVEIRKKTEDILELLYLFAFILYIGFFFLGNTMFQIDSAPVFLFRS